MLGINSTTNVRANTSEGFIHRARRVLKKYAKFIGPGLMVSVAYMDPGNYSTAVAAGSAYKYKLLFSILLSNCLAIFLQTLSAKLGAVTGLDLAANCRANLSPRLNIFIYILAEIAIIATDLAEVVGTAIALNIIFKIPLLLGVVVTVVDVLIVLMAYRPNGPLLFIRIFESFVSVLVAATVVCFGIELWQVHNDSSLNFSFKEVIQGFLPNEKVIDMSDRKGGNGLFLSLAILGATVMPHSLYLGSGLVQSRLKDFDIKNGFYKPLTNNIETVNELNRESTEVTQPLTGSKKYVEKEDEEECYKPSIHAIDNTMSYTLVELVVSLFTVALFVNSAILIVSGATLHSNKSSTREDNDNSDYESDVEDYNNADLFTIYNLLADHLSGTAGFVFALALLCSGQSAGVVCTLAGQMVSEGFLRWSFSPVIRRLLTRGLAIAPCVIVVGFAGREGLARALNASQVVLSLLLPFVSAPLVYFTCSKSIMKVSIYGIGDGEQDDGVDIDSYIDFEDHVSNSVKRFESTEPAIMLQDLRKSNPCGGWYDDEFEDGEHQNFPSSVGSESQSSVVNTEIGHSNHESQTSISETLQGSNSENTPLSRKLIGYKDMSNGPITTSLAIGVWGFITCLNVFLVGSMLLGYDIPL